MFPHLSFLLAASDAAALPASRAALGALVVALLAALILAAASWCVVFSKAGEPWWAAIVPVYGFWVMLRIARKPGWWMWFLLLGLVPVVGVLLTIAVGIAIGVGVARRFGRGPGFGVGLALLPFVFAPILAFGEGHPGAAAA